MSNKINENYNPNQKGNNISIRDNTNPKRIEKSTTPPPPGGDKKSK